MEITTYALTEEDTLGVSADLIERYNQSRIAHFSAQETVVDNSWVVDLNQGLSALEKIGTTLNIRSSFGYSLQVQSESVDQQVHCLIGDNIYSAKVAESYQKSTMTYEESVDFFMGWRGQETTIATKATEQKTQFNLNEARYVDITTFDASQQSSAVEINGAADLNNKLISSQGGGTLYGGGSTDDTMTGNRNGGATTVKFGLNDGHDTFKSFQRNDSVYLSNCTIEDISYFNVESNTMTIAMRDGGTLKIQGELDSAGLYSGASNIYLGGQGYVYDAKSRQFSMK